MLVPVEVALAASHARERLASRGDVDAAQDVMTFLVLRGPSDPPPRGHS